jgi:hypothetical protein
MAKDNGSDGSPRSEFEISGPWTIPVVGDLIPKEKQREFWDEVGEIADRRGCYVFSIRTGGGVVPIYVGRATNTFRQECFGDHKLANHYYPALSGKVGTPLMFFVHQITRKNRSMIAKLEDFLIQIALDRNPCLSNVTGRGEHRETFRIWGVHNTGPGKPSEAALLFRRVMGFAE